MLMRPACSAYLRVNTKTCMTATQTVRVDASSAASSRLRRGASFPDDSYRENANIYHPVYSYGLLGAHSGTSRALLQNPEIAKIP